MGLILPSYADPNRAAVSAAAPGPGGSQAPPHWQSGHAARTRFRVGNPAVAAAGSSSAPAAGPATAGCRRRTDPGPDGPRLGAPPEPEGVSRRGGRETRTALRPPSCGLGDSEPPLPSTRSSSESPQQAAPCPRPRPAPGMPRPGRAGPAMPANRWRAWRLSCRATLPGPRLAAKPESEPSLRARGPQLGDVGPVRTRMRGPPALTRGRARARRG